MPIVPKFVLSQVAHPLLLAMYTKKNCIVDTHHTHLKIHVLIAIGTHPLKCNHQVIQIFSKKKLETRGHPVLSLNQSPEDSLDVLRLPNEDSSHLANDPLD